MPTNAVYVGRPSRWGNPYTHLGSGTRASIKVETREQSIEMYRAYITAKLEDSKVRTAMRRELRGRDLVCWCAPEPCHADILLELANGSDTNPS